MNGEIEGVKIKPLKVHCDDRGYLYEVLRSDDEFFNGFSQSNITMTYPGVIKAFHWHKKQDDIWVVAKGEIMAVLYDLRKKSKTYGTVQTVFMGDNNRIALYIPRGVAHGYKVLGTEPAILVYYTNQLYNPKDPDEQRIPYNDKKIGFDWETKFR